MRMVLRVLQISLLFVTAARSADRLEWVWPVPNPAWSQGKSAEAFLQHAGSGEAQSGNFGGVRSSGTQFHEGIDLQPLARDRRGEPTDPVFAVMTGVVRHVSTRAGESSYGRYVVLEHPSVTPAIYTLYAHLAAVKPEIRAGAQVSTGQTLGTMGHSSGGYMIPKDRAHLHFEMGVVITRDFQTWYDQRKFGSRNEHGMWNGMNLMGVDPLTFFNDWRSRRIDSVLEYFQQLPPAVTVRIATYRMPDFVTRYPALLTRPVPFGLVSGWEIAFNWSGVPFAWTPLTAGEVVGLPREKPSVVKVDAPLERRERSRSLAVLRRSGWTVGKDLEIVLQQLFGLR